MLSAFRTRKICDWKPFCIKMIIKHIPDSHSLRACSLSRARQIQIPARKLRRSASKKRTSMSKLTMFFYLDASYLYLPCASMCLTFAFRARKKPQTSARLSLGLPSAPSGVRTLDTLIKSQVLYQLS